MSNLTWHCKPLIYGLPFPCLFDTNKHPLDMGEIGYVSAQNWEIRKPTRSRFRPMTKLNPTEPKRFGSIGFGSDRIITNKKINGKKINGLKRAKNSIGYEGQKITCNYEQQHQWQKNQSTNTKSTTISTSTATNSLSPATAKAK